MPLKLAFQFIIFLKKIIKNSNEFRYLKLKTNIFFRIFHILLSVVCNATRQYPWFPWCRYLYLFVCVCVCTGRQNKKRDYLKTNRIGIQYVFFPYILFTFYHIDILHILLQNQSSAILQFVEVILHILFQTSLKLDRNLRLWRKMYQICSFSGRQVVRISAQQYFLKRVHMFPTTAMSGMLIKKDVQSKS